MHCQRLSPGREATSKLHRVIAIYPGSFDPPTNGHLDLIQRGSKVFDELIVAVLQNSDKNPLFSAEERRAMLGELAANFNNVRVDTFGGLLVDYTRKVNAHVVLRGIRAISDYEYELQMALMNRTMEPNLETVFLTASEAYSYLSSRIVKDIAQLGGSVHGMVPPSVEQELQRKLNLIKTEQQMPLSLNEDRTLASPKSI
ncbi:MAG: pantetheine-phosphate adenylyltransferase [Terriglobales bacterium]